MGAVTRGRKLVNLDAEDAQAVQAIAAGAIQIGIVLATLTFGVLWGIGMYHLVRWLV